MSQAIQTDVLIVGAGPAALFSVFQMGLFGVSCHVVDILDRPGGQCTELYSDKPIYDIPAFPSLIAQELIDRLVAQIAPFNPKFTFNCLVTDVEPLNDGTFRVRTNEDEVFEARAVVIAMGSGSFQPKRLWVTGIESLDRKAVSYSVRNIEDFRGEDVTILGNDDATLDWAAKILSVARSMAVLHESPEAFTEPGQHEKLSTLRQSPNFALRTGKISGLKATGSCLEAIVIQSKEGEFQLACTRLLPILGRAMKAGAPTAWGLKIHDDLIVVDAEQFGTSTPGVFAIGDACFYPGKLRLIVSAFHEATLMTQGVRRFLRAGGRAAPQYTTSSTELQTKLGVR